MIQINLFANQKQTHLWLPRGKGWVGDNLKWIINKDLLYSTGNSAQYSVISYMGKQSEKEWTQIDVKTDSLCYTPETTF